MRERGCGWSGTVEHLEHHLSPNVEGNCQYMDQKCPLNCNQSIPRSRMEQHLVKECAQREYACQYCSFKDTYQMVVDTHLPQCINYRMQCTNLGTNSVMENDKSACCLKEVGCEFSGLGCDARLKVEEREEHCRQNTQKHLALTAAASVTMNIMLQQKLQELEKNIVMKFHEQEQEINGQNQKFREQIQKLEKQGNGKKLVQEITKFPLRRTFAIENFGGLKVREVEDEDWKSPAMYTHACGYKFCIGVHPNGIGKGIMAVYLYSMQGEYDHMLKWPAQAGFTIQLLNNNMIFANRVCKSEKITWKKPERDYTRIFSFKCEATSTYKEQPYGFIEDSDLENFVRNDTLYFHLTSIYVM